MKNKIISLFIGNTLNSLMPIIIPILFTRYLPKEDYATYRQTWLVLSLTAPLFLLSIPSSFIYVLKVFNEKRKRDDVFWFLILFLIFISLVNFFFIGFTKQIWANNLNNSQLTAALDIIKYFFFYNAISHSIIFIFNGIDKLKLGILLSIISTFLLTSQKFISAFLGQNYLEILAYNNYVSYFLLFVFAFVFLREFNLRLKGYDANFYDLKVIFFYALPIYFSSVLFILSARFGPIVISHFMNSEKFVEYSLGAFTLPFVMIITSSIFDAIFPSQIDLYRSGNIKGLLHQWKSVIKKSYAVMFSICIFALFFSNEIIEILFTSSYKNAAIPFRIYTLFLIISCARFMSLIQVTGKTKPIFYSSVLGNLITVLSTIPFFKLFGFVGPALSFFLGGLSNKICTIIISKKTLNIKYTDIIPVSDLIKISISVLLFSTPFFVISYFIKTTYLKILIGGISWLLVILLISIKYIPSIFDILKTILKLKTIPKLEI